jgi:hypothetical protein
MSGVGALTESLHQLKLVTPPEHVVARLTQALATWTAAPSDARFWAVFEVAMECRQVMRNPPSARWRQRFGKITCVMRSKLMETRDADRHTQKVDHYLRELFGVTMCQKRIHRVNRLCKIHTRGGAKYCHVHRSSTVVEGSLQQASSNMPTAVIDLVQAYLG